MVCDRVLGCIIKCPVHENDKCQERGTTRSRMSSRPHRREGRTVQPMLGEQHATTFPWFRGAGEVRPCIFVLPIQLRYDTTVRDGKQTPLQGLVDTCRSHMQYEPFQCLWHAHVVEARTLRHVRRVSTARSPDEIHSVMTSA